MSERVCLGVSACLGGALVRYDGQLRPMPWIVEEAPRLFDIVFVCPEFELGLGVPRPPVELYWRDASIGLRECASGRELSERMQRWCESRLDALQHAPLSGFVLKARSPSCGLDEVPVHDALPGLATHGDGLFAAALRCRWPQLPLCTDEHLLCPARRAAFVSAVRSFAARQHKHA